MTDDLTGACRRALEDALAAGGTMASDAAAILASTPAAALERTLREFADAQGAGALPVLVALGAGGHGGVRRAAKRALYRLAQRGIKAPPKAAARPVIERREGRPVRAWVSAVDGSGSRAIWILFEGAFGGLELCSLIVNDTVGILEVAGGGITRKRLDSELAALRADQKLPWLECAPDVARGLVAEAWALHRALGRTTPPAFARWQRRFDDVIPTPPVAPSEPDPGLVARGAELLDVPETAGWFLEPGDVQSEALELLQAHESRLVVSDQVKGEREEALITRVVERELHSDVRQRWARRLLEQAVVFDATARATLGELARAAAGALAGNADVTSQPFPRALARRALEVAGEVATGRLAAADVTRKPSVAAV
ncbi:MAG TPA: hypothetical protein VGQ77_01225 [Methylomirabilota bacterium]|nr:hypothetical protein [Methylomirabilota bacterium]